MIFRLARTFLIFHVVAILPSLSQAEMIAGGDIVHLVKKGETIGLISARSGVNGWKIAKDNNIDTGKRLQIGQELKINTRRIVPVTKDHGIVINIPDRTLYYFKNGHLARLFPVGLGLLTSKTGRSWKTPLGKFKVMAKEKNPTWYVPPSIQEEMALEGKEVITMMPPGPRNPLGRFALRTSIPGIMIHETIQPSSVNQYRSHGCIRVGPEHMEKFFEEVEPEVSGEVIYMPVKAAVSPEGRIYLEAHRDVYQKIKVPLDEARAHIERTGAINKVDWQKVEKVLKEKTGVPEDVTL